jgi:hypothetical protein
VSELLLGEGEAALEEEEATPSDQPEWPFTVELLPLDALVVDRSYQRPVEDRFVKRMADDFDETLVGALDVSDRGPDVWEGKPDGSRVYAILDGQQRWEVMKLVGKTTCYAATFTGMDIEDEAGFFFRKNKDRRAMQGYYGFRARVVAGDLSAVAVQDAVEAQGFRFGPKSDHESVIVSVSACEQAWNFSSEHRDESLSPTLATIRENFRGQQSSLEARVILAFATFWRRYADEEIDPETLTAALGYISTPRNLTELGRQQQETGSTLASAMAEVIVESYNRRRQSAPLPPLKP